MWSAQKGPDFACISCVWLVFYPGSLLLQWVVPLLHVSLNVCCLAGNFLPKRQMCLHWVQSAWQEKMGEADLQSSARSTWRHLAALVWLVAIRGVAVDTEVAGVASSKARARGRTTRAALPGAKVRATRMALQGVKARGIRMALVGVAEGRATIML